MPTIPTGRMERELRALYLRWLAGVTMDGDVNGKVDLFERQSKDLIEKLGGRTAALGALAGFPVPKRLDLSPHVGTIYSDMKQAAIQAGMSIGLGATDVAQQMFRLGMDKSFNRLNRLARTETVSSYWKNAWDSIADLPLLVMVWGSEDGPRTCAWCRERDGLVMDSPNLRDHPNGRCTPIPMLRSEVKYRGSISADGSLHYDPAWNRPKTARLAPGSLPVPTVARDAGVALPTGLTGVVKTSTVGQAVPMSAKYTVSLKDANGTQVYTAKDLDEPGFKPAGDTIRQALEFAVGHTQGFTVDMDTYEFRPAKVATVVLRDAGGMETLTIEQAKAILAGR